MLFLLQVWCGDLQFWRSVPGDLKQEFNLGSAGRNSRSKASAQLFCKEGDGRV